MPLTTPSRHDRDIAPALALDKRERFEFMNTQVRFRLADRSEDKLAPNRKLPAVIEPAGRNGAGNLPDFIRHQRVDLAAMLTEHGALLFRGFDVSSPAAFEQVALAMDPNLADIHPLDDIKRIWHTRFIFDAMNSLVTEASPNMLTFHHEDTYLSVSPAKIMFCCLKASEAGGETPIVDTREVYKSLPPRIQRRYSECRLLSPQSFSFDIVSANARTTVKDEIEAICLDHGVENVQWDDDGLLIESCIDPVIQHPESGETVWYNRAKNAHPWGVVFERVFALPYCADLELLARFGYRTVALAYSVLARTLRGEMKARRYRRMRFEDGSPIPIWDQFVIAQTYWRHAVVLRWQPGDVMVLDNRITAHARMPFRGRRKIVACVTSPTRFCAHKGIPLKGEQ